MIKISMNKNVYNVNIGMINWCSDHKAFSAKTPLKKPFKMSILNDKKSRRMNTAAINELLCMKNAGAQIAMDFS